jgi:hypothetical protein
MNNLLPDGETVAFYSALRRLHAYVLIVDLR